MKFVLQQATDIITYLIGVFDYDAPHIIYFADTHEAARILRVVEARMVIYQANLGSPRVSLLKMV